MPKKKKPADRYFVEADEVAGTYRVAVREERRIRRIGPRLPNSYEAWQRVDRLNMLDDSDRAAAARLLRSQLGRSRTLFTCGIGWNRRTGGRIGILCLIASKGSVINVSGGVSTVLDWKWNDDGTVAALDTEYGLTDKLSHLLYGDARRLTHKQV